MKKLRVDITKGVIRQLRGEETRWLSGIERCARKRVVTGSKPSRYTSAPGQGFNRHYQFPRRRLKAVYLMVASLHA